MLDELDIKLHAQIASCVGLLENKGYSEDQIVAIDFDDDKITFFMTDGSQIKIKPKFLWFQ
jgi:hypothetical protein